MPKGITSLLYKTRALAKSGGISSEGQKELEKLVRQIEHAFAVRNHKRLQLLFDQLCKLIIELIESLN
jgi:hypothetical protein